MVGMLQRALKSEMMKFKHSPIWLAFILIPFISAFMGTFNYYGNREILKEEWYSLWTQHTIFYCYFCLPALIGIYCSYFCRIENMNHNWKSLLAEPVPISSLYLAKFLCIMSVITMTQVLVGALFFISGKLMRFQSNLPMEMIGWLVMGTVASMAICAFQLTVSVMLRSFALPIGIAAIGGIMSVVARGMGVPLVWWYALFSVGMCSSSPQTGLECSAVSFLLCCLGFTMVFMMSGLMYMKGTIAGIKMKL